MSSFADRFGKLTVAKAKELNEAASLLDTIREMESETSF